MGILDRKYSEAFYRWEWRARGWHVWPDPVKLEPPLHPLKWPDQSRLIDDGRKTTTGSRWIQNLANILAPDTRAVTPAEDDGAEAPEFPESPTPAEIACLRVELPKGYDPKPEKFANIFHGIANCESHLAFELIGLPQGTITQFAGTPKDIGYLQRRLQAEFPEAIFALAADALDGWLEAPGYAAIAEFALAREFLFPLAHPDYDLLVDFATALSQPEDDEIAIYQVLFQPLKEAWANSLLQMVADPMGKPFFINAPEFLSFARQKVSSPLFATVIRNGAIARTSKRAWELVGDLSRGFNALSDPSGNELLPLSNLGYEPVSHWLDVYTRQSRRLGAILNQRELLALAHLPTKSVQSPKFVRLIHKTRSLPKNLRRDDGILLGENEHAGVKTEVRVIPDQRVRHMHVIGTPGTGKSTFLYQMIRQDIDAGNGLALFDPHGDLVEKILGIIPERRAKDVILFDPSDPDAAIGFNVLSAEDTLEKNVLASDLVAIFERLSRTWGDQMNSVFRNAILAFLENTQPGTLQDLQRFLIEPAFRKKVLATVTKPHVVYFWEKSFPLLTGNKSVGPIVTRLEELLSRDQIREIVLQKNSRFRFSEILSGRKIFLARLSQGLIGRENVALLGSVLVAKFQQAAMGRESIPEKERSDFFIYIDEFQNFITPSVAEMLTSTRKYRVGLTLAHQDFGKIKSTFEVENAVKSIPLIRVVFRSGAMEAHQIASSFTNFDESDFQNLPDHNAICRIERNDFDFNLRVLAPEFPSEIDAEENRARARQLSNSQFATPRSELANIGLSFSDIGSIATSPQRPKAEDHAPRAATAPLESTTPAPPTQSQAAPATEMEPPADVKGHEWLKDQISKFAASLYYVPDREHKVLGKRRIDLVLSRGALQIACEVAEGNQVAFELRNIQKCLDAGFKNIAVVSRSGGHLQAIRRRLAELPSTSALELVRFYTLPEFFKQLKTWAEADPAGAAQAKSLPQVQKIQLDAKLSEDQAEEKLNELRRKLKGGDASPPSSPN